MGGSKSKQPQSTSKEGKIRDPEIETLVREGGTSRQAVHDLIKEAAPSLERFSGVTIVPLLRVGGKQGMMQ